MNDNERTDLAELIKHCPPVVHEIVDAVLSSEWLKSHDVGVAVAATRKALTDFADELQDGLDAFDANQERFTIGPMFDMGGSTVVISLIARLRARGIAAVDLPWRQIVDSQSHED